MRIPRFSLLSVFIPVTVISLWLGMAAYVYENRLTWRELVWIPFGCLWCGFVYWLYSSASWSVRMFVIGFFVGVSIEGASMDLWITRDWIEYSPPPLVVPKGYYPLTLPVGRILVEVGLADPYMSDLRPWALGSILSGFVGGTFFWIFWRYFRKSKLVRQSRSDDR